MREQVLVTGASGFIGGALVRQMTRIGYPVIAVSRQRIQIAGTQCEPVHGDHTIQMDHLLEKTSFVIHAAARVHLMQDSAANPLAEFRKVNVEETLKLARQAAKAGVKRFVFMSSIKVNGEVTEPGQVFSADDAPNPLDAYGVSKHEAELGLRQIAVDTGMQVTIIRPPLVYGPGVRANFHALMQAVARGIPLPLGAIDNPRSLVALDNLLDFIEACIKHPAAANQTFLVRDEEDLSTPELIRSMARAMGKPARLIPVPVWMLEAGGALFGKREVVRRLCGNLQVDIEKARNLLGWVPPISVVEGLRRAVAEWRA
jgi:nucleoside-diphosphate-sugar epimerase